MATPIGTPFGTPTVTLMVTPIVTATVTPTVTLASPSVGATVGCVCEFFFLFYWWLQLRDPHGLANYSVTFADWSAHRWHPRLFAQNNITVEDLRILKVNISREVSVHHSKGGLLACAAGT